MSEYGTKAARIFIIDDHPVVRQGLQLLFMHAAHIVCGEAESVGSVMERLVDADADIALLDLSLGDESGLGLIEGIRATGCAVLVYSMHEDAATIERAFAAGANGYVSKRESEDILLQAVSDLLVGRRHISPLAAQSMTKRPLSGPAIKHVLSERESTILACLGRGDSNVEIAAALSISVRTVETYCARLIIKLELEGMRALRHYAIRKTLSTLTE